MPGGKNRRNNRSGGEKVKGGSAALHAAAGVAVVAFALGLCGFFGGGAGSASVPPVGSAASDGGYVPDPVAEAHPAYHASQCNIEHRAYISDEDFEEHYRNKKPVIFTNVTDNMRTSLFAKDHLKKHFGSILVKTGISKHISKNRGDGYNAMPLRDFIGEMSGKQEVANDPVSAAFALMACFFCAGTEINRRLPVTFADLPRPPLQLYMFDLNDFFADAPDLAAALGDGIPRHFSTGNWEAPNVYFALGGSKSGTQFHKHEEGWYMQIFGKKKWMLYAPSDMPPIHYPPFSLSVQEWLETLYPQLGAKRQPHQCTLGAGDLIYVPETWCKCCFAL